MLSNTDDVVPLGCERQPVQRGLGMAVAIHPLDPRIVYAAFGDTGAGNDVPGVFKSVDGGETWFEARAGLGSEGCYPLEGCTCTPGINWLYLDPGEPERLFASTHQRGLYRTEDGGRSWHRLGLPDYCLGVGPVARGPDGTLHTACGGIRFESLDGGSTWDEMGLVGYEHRFVGAFTFESARPERVWAAMMSASTPVAGVGWVYRSDDRGQSWAELARDVDEECQGRGYALALDVCDANPNWLAVAIYDCGLFVSDDGGTSWHRAMAPMDRLQPVWAQYAPSMTECVLFASEERNSALARSEDNGSSWVEEVHRPLESLSFNPYEPRVVSGMNRYSSTADARRFELWIRE
jgi:photosystem II stability/assembly factor-like uncharacterized protein